MGQNICICVSKLNRDREHFWALNSGSVQLLEESQAEFWLQPSSALSNDSQVQLWNIQRPTWSVSLTWG